MPKQYKVSKAHRIHDLYIDWLEVYSLTGTGKFEALTGDWLLGLI